jgi:hypothetical protein
MSEYQRKHFPNPDVIYIIVTLPVVAQVMICTNKYCSYWILALTDDTMFDGLFVFSQTMFESWCKSQTL